MKKILLLAAAFFVATASFAQENLAIGGTATATAGNDNANLAIDSKEDTRWEAPQADCNNNENVEWNLELTEKSTFNTIQILWETAYSKSFVISVSDNGSDYTEVLSVTEELNFAGKSLQTYKLGNDVTAKYIKFKNLARGTQYGVSFYEFRVFNVAGEMVLNTIDLSSPANPFTKKDFPIALDAKGKDVLGHDIEIPNLEYIITKGNGTISGDTFTPTQVGETKIKAKSGNIESDEITYYVHSGSKIDILETSKMELIDTTLSAQMSNAFDSNLATDWQMCGANNNKSHNIGFEINLQDTYDITDVFIKFERACPADYTVSFAGSDHIYSGELAHSIVGNPDPQGNFIDFFASEAKGVQYIKFNSTKAATDWGVRMFDFSVFSSSKKMTVTDNEKGVCVIKGEGESADAISALLNDESKTAYDITGLTFPETVTSFKVANPNAMIIVTDEQATQLTNMKNLFWLKEGGYFISRGVYEITDGYPVYTKFFISAEKGYTYTREISGGKYVTTTLPAGVTLPAGISAYEFGSSKDNVYTFNKKADKELKAHTPYILYSAEKTLLTVTVNGNTDLYMCNYGEVKIQDIVCGDLTFHGNYETFAGDGSQYGLLNNSDENSIVLKSVNGGTIGAFRGYFTINGTTSGAKDIRFIFNNGGTDGISSVNSETTVNAANVYTIDGRFVNSNGSVAGLAKGLYIVGGKKVIVK